MESSTSGNLHQESVPQYIPQTEQSDNQYPYPFNPSNISPQKYQASQYKSDQKSMHLDSPLKQEAYMELQMKKTFQKSQIQYPQISFFADKRFNLQSKFEEIMQSQQRNDGKLSLESAVIFDDGRSHYVFSDKTGLILHPDGDCFTYFSKDGKKLRQLVKYAVNSAVSKDGGIPLIDKLVLALQFYNSFGDEPILNREELLKQEQMSSYERETRLHKFTKVSWPGTQNFEDYISQDEEGNIHLKSIDSDLAEMVLAANGFQFTITFLYLLPFKTPSWTAVEEGQRSTIQNLTRHQQQESRIMKMAYEYVKITQIHSLGRFPSRWCYPLSLILHYKETKKGCEGDYVMPPQFCQKFQHSNQDS